jgi:hypothetical protein
MLVLLGISTALALVVPDPRERDRKEETGSTTGTTGATGATGTTGGTGDEGADPPSAKPAESGLTEATLNPVKKGESPPVAEADPSGRLILTVKTADTVDVSIPALGRTAVATRYAPAVFDLILPSEPAEFAVFDTATGKKIGEVKTDSSDSAKGD